MLRALLDRTFVRNGRSMPIRPRSDEMSVRPRPRRKPASPTAWETLFRTRCLAAARVAAMTPMGSDTLVEVRFDTKGTKKIMANFAKLVRIEE